MLNIYLFYKKKKIIYQIKLILFHKIIKYISKNGHL
jgi:hypothetical protein